MATVLKLLIVVLLAIEVIALNREVIRENDNVLVPSNDINLSEKIKQVDNGKTVDGDELYMNDSNLLDLGELVPKDKYLKMLQNYKNANNKLNDNNNWNSNISSTTPVTINTTEPFYNASTTQSTQSSFNLTTLEFTTTEFPISKNDSESKTGDDDDGSSDDDMDGIECVLKTAGYYLKWVADNGILRIENIDMGEKFFTDHSYKFKNQKQYDTYVNELKSVENINRDKFMNLKILSLGFNNLQKLPKQLLNFSSDSLERLSLIGNNFELLFLNDSFDHHTSLLELDLRNCKLTKITDNLLANLNNITAIYLSNNSIADIHVNAFIENRKLKHLDLAYNRILTLTDANEVTKLPKDPYVETINGLNLKKDQFLYSKFLEHLDLSHTKIDPKSVVSLESLPRNLIRLSICFTDLPVVTNDTFSNLTGLEVLDMSGNQKISTFINEKVFQAFSRNLKVLYFQSSNIKSLEWTKPLKKLQVLSLRNNFITAVESKEILQMEHLQTLDLESNYITNWYNRILTFNRHLEFLNLRNNKINTLTVDMKNDLVNVEVLGLGNNEFECSCVLHEFFNKILDNTVSSSKNLDASINVIPTTTPSEPSRMSWSMKHRQRYLDAIQNPPSKFDILTRHFLAIFRLIKKSSKILSNNNFTKMGQPHIIGSDGRMYDSIEHKIFKENLLDKNVTTILFDYSEEDYQCIENQKNKTPIVRMLDQCDDEEAPDDFLNPDDRASPFVPVIVSLTTVSVLMLAAIIIYWKWWYIKYFFIVLKNSTILSFMMDDKELLKKQETQSYCEGGFIYDVFVSYCDENREWVLNHLLPSIEKREEINVCLHERDFQVGYSILENIISCMDRSRVLLLVISESFLLSQWCQFEMHLAQHRLLETRRDKLILVLLEDISNRKQSKTLKYLMKTKTYIKWPAEEDIDQQKLFWKRLKRAIISSNWENEASTYGSIQSS